MKFFVKSKRPGHLSDKILLLLEAGIILGLTQRPDRYFKVIKDVRKEWKKIDARSLHESIKRLYQSKLVECKTGKNGITQLVISEDGKRKMLRYKINNMEIRKPKSWDGLWRVVLFDIPEKFKNGRDALAGKLKKLGFYPIQKSIFVFPYECKDEIDFIVEFFNLRPYIRVMVVKEIDIDEELRQRFDV